MTGANSSELVSYTRVIACSYWIPGNIAYTIVLVKLPITMCSRDLEAQNYIPKDEDIILCDYGQIGRTIVSVTVNTSI
jgi:hypothetical protein